MSPDRPESKRAIPLAIAPRDKGQRVWERLLTSDGARRFQVAFSVATGLPLTFVPVTVPNEETGAGRRGAFCIDGCMGSKSGKPCLSTLQQAERRANTPAQPVVFPCPAGLLKVLVPVVIGGQHVGNLLAGPFSVEQLDTERLNRLSGKLKELNLENQARNLQKSWNHSPVITKEKVQAVLTLVSVFAEYLTQTGNQWLAAEATSGSTLLEKVESYLSESEEETISLKDVAKRVAVSPCHFCKMFKKQTGVTFSEYRVRRRLEKAQQLLLDPNLRISEAAFQAGFDSLPYFNRAFRRFVGCSPSEFRAQNGLHKSGQ